MLRSLPGNRRDDDQLAELYAAHRLGLVRLAILLVDDLASAEDVVQDAFTAFASRTSRLREPAAALGYLRTSVVNGSRSALRRRRTARGYTPAARGRAGRPRRPGGPERGAPGGARRARPARRRASARCWCCATGPA